MDVLAERLYYLWALLAGLGAIVFGAGMVAEKVRCDRYVTKEVHSADLKTIDAKFETIQVQLGAVQTSLNKLTDWVDRVRD
jgi:hypothetical protein